MEKNEDSVSHWKPVLARVHSMNVVHRSPGELSGSTGNNYRTRVRSLFTLVTNSLTDSLTDSCLVNLIDVTLACEDANSKLVDVVTVADEDRVGNNLL